MQKSLKAETSSSSIDPLLITHLVLTFICKWLSFSSYIPALIKPTTSLVDDSQADNLFPALPLFAFCHLSQQCYDMKKTIAQKASCHGFTQRRGIGACDANKRARKITRATNSTANRQLHEPVFPLREGRWQATGKTNESQTLEKSHTHTPNFSTAYTSAVHTARQ